VGVQFRIVRPVGMAELLEAEAMTRLAADGAEGGQPGSAPITPPLFTKGFAVSNAAGWRCLEALRTPIRLRGRRTRQTKLGVLAPERRIAPFAARVNAAPELGQGLGQFTARSGPPPAPGSAARQLALGRFCQRVSL